LVAPGAGARVFLEDQMKNVAFVVVALGTLVACNNSRPNVVDSGGIVLSDSGGGGHDTGAGGHDSGSGGTTCGTFTGTGVWPALPATCLPRCTTATGNAYNTCAMMTDMTAAQSCIDAALAADHTATVMVGDGMGNNISVSCGGNSTDTFGCLDYQLNAAIDTQCDTEFTAYLTCATMLPAGTSGMTGCPTEYSAVNNCVTAHMAAVQASYNMLAGACFGG
jgi:hypothetical protein